MKVLKRLNAMGYVCAVGVFMLLALGADAANWYVSPNGLGSQNGTSAANAWRWPMTTAQWNLVNGGDTVFFTNGTYTTNLTPGKNGTSGARITIKALNQHQAILDGGWSRYNIINVEGKSNLNIHGFLVKKAQQAGNVAHSAVWVKSSSNIDIQNVKIELERTRGITVNQGTNVDIEGCQIYEKTNNTYAFATDAILAQNSTNLDIMGNDIRNYNIAYQGDGSDSATSPHVDCIQLFENNNVFVAYNYIENRNWLPLHKHLLMIERNDGTIRFWNNVMVGTMTGSSEIYLGKRNIDSKNGREQFYNNTIICQSDNVFELINADNTEIRNNIIVNTKSSGKILNAGAGNFNGVNYTNDNLIAARNIYVYGNNSNTNVFGRLNSTDYTRFDANSGTGNAWSSKENQPLRTTLAALNFNSSGTGGAWKYQLLSGSSAINTGWDLSWAGFTNDIWGRARGTSWELGAFAF